MTSWIKRCAFIPILRKLIWFWLAGCANDVGLQNLLNASRTSEVDDMTKTKCGKPVKSLLRRIATTFPAARIILTGCYPFFSAETRNDFVVKALARRFF